MEGVGILKRSKRSVLTISMTTRMNTNASVHSLMALLRLGSPEERFLPVDEEAIRARRSFFDVRRFFRPVGDAAKIVSGRLIRTLAIGLHVERWSPLFRVWRGYPFKEKAFPVKTG